MKPTARLFALILTVVPFAAQAVPLPTVVLQPNGMAEPLIAPTLGFGQRPCKDWTQMRVKKTAPSSILAAQWALGYFSAFNAFAPAGHTDFAPADSKTLMTTIDAQCAQHPLVPIANVVHRIIDGQAKHH